MASAARIPAVVIRYRNFAPIVEAFGELGYAVLGESEALAAAPAADIALYLIDPYDEIKSPIRSLAIKRRFNRAGVPLIAWNRDGPANKGEKAWRMWLLRHLPYFDVYASHTLQGAEAFRASSAYLPNAAWMRHYNLGGRTLADLRDPRRYRWDVSFFGRFDAARYPEMREREDFLGALRARLHREGVSLHLTDAPLSHAEQRELVQATRVNLQVHAGADACYHRTARVRERSWGLPERCYGVPACGGFLLSDERAHAALDFEPGREWVAFRDLEACCARVRAALADFAATRDIADAQYRRVLRDHTYVHRARRLLALAAAWRHHRQPSPTA